MSAIAISDARWNAEPQRQAGVQARSWVHWLALAFVAVTIASSGFVFSEPAPVDALTIGLIVLLPTIGLIAINPAIVAYASLWLVVCASAVLAATLSLDLAETLKHVGVTIYLCMASVVFAAFIAKSPKSHTELILKAWTGAAVAIAATAIAGYFNLVPGAYDLFTKFGRASGTFKDPNVLGPFLIVPLLYMLHLTLQRPLHRMIVPLGVAGFFALAVLLSFSRGAWMNLACAIAVYGYLAFVTGRSAILRLKILALVFVSGLLVVGTVAVALQFDQVSNLLNERASLTQSYDMGPEGRFGGQEKAVGVIAENPLGIGAKEFVGRYHHEEVHNVYLSVVLNAGWLGGGVYWILVGLTLAFGLRHALKATPTRPLFLIVYAAFLANALEGMIIDTDHWRHFYLLMAIVWGLMSERATARAMLDRIKQTLAAPARPPHIRAPAAASTIGKRPPRMKRAPVLRPAGPRWRGARILTPVYAA